MKQKTGRLILGIGITVLLILLGFSSLQGVAAPLFAPPIPPGTPTGLRPTRLPPFDTRQLDSQKTPVGGVDPGDEADTSLAAESVPTVAPLKIKDPSSTWKKYRDSDIGFSFSYPQNWNLDAPNGEKAPKAPEGTDVILQNFDDVDTGGTVSTDQIKIELVVQAVPDSTSLTDWVAEQQKIYTDAGISYSLPDKIVVDKIPAVRWKISPPLAPEGIVEVVVVKGKWLYTITAYPAASSQISTFDKIIKTLKFQ
ncbi:MAG: hypothetical protein HY741_17905 [Chloroflexi bacterium]|nr:hypothetical protein [Chloroflexota bacterium]